LDDWAILPIDQHGADLLFQVISQRTSGGPCSDHQQALQARASVFNNDSTIASAVLDRLLHHAETIVIEAPASE